MIGRALATALAAGRTQFNQRVRAAQQHPGFDANAWRAFIRDTLDPVAGAVERHDASAVTAVVETLYEQALPLLAKRWLGPEAREPVLAASYRELLVALAPALARDPARLSGALLNALHQLCQSDSQRARQWSSRLAQLGAGLVDIDGVLGLGRVLAWRAGWPAYREAALEAAPRLPGALVKAALDLATTPSSGLWSSLVSEPTLRADEVGTPAAHELRWLGWCGGFRGLGGPFAGLPVVGLAQGTLAASDGGSSWRLMGDGYGTQVLKIGAAGDWPLAAARGKASISAAGAVSAGTLARDFAELESATAWAWHAGLLAVTLRTSYQVALLRCPLP